MLRRTVSLGEEMKDFYLTWVDDGILLGCLRCGVVHWRKGAERDLEEVIEEATLHLSGCSER
jgi:hypothetical protein